MFQLPLKTRESLFVKQKCFLENQAFNAILFLYKEILEIDTSNWNIQALRVKRREHMPVVLTKEEVKRVFLYEWSL